MDDLKNEAWAMALDLEYKGQPMDLASPADQDSMLGKLYGKFVRPLRTRIGFALRFDKDWDKSDEDAGQRLHDTVPASELSDPVRALEEREVTTALDTIRLHSYSQATAYAICLHRWSDTGSLANYLAIKLETLNTRVRYWRNWIKYQPSLFDGIERVSLDFRPHPGTPSACEGISDQEDERQQSLGF